MNDFRGELEQLINLHSKENGSNTPDFILAGFLTDCLDTFDRTVKCRDDWYGVALRPGWDSDQAETVTTKNREK
jgi:hypothetical protein